jgi:hypothetical protein
MISLPGDQPHSQAAPINLGGLVGRDLPAAEAVDRSLRRNAFADRSNHHVIDDQVPVVDSKTTFGLKNASREHTKYSSLCELISDGEKNLSIDFGVPRFIILF